MLGKAPTGTSVAHQVPFRGEAEAASIQVLSRGVITKEHEWLPAGARGANQKHVIRKRVPGWGSFPASAFLGF